MPPSATSTATADVDRRPLPGVSWSICGGRRPPSRVRRRSPSSPR